MAAGGLPSDPARPWDTGEFSLPVDPAGADDLDAEQVLAQMWDGQMPTGEPGDEDWQAMRAPVSRQFPGLAPPEHTLPPRSIGHAQRIVAGHFVFCDECAGRGLHDVPRITASLMESPAWTFWWN